MERPWLSLVQVIESQSPKTLCGTLCDKYSQNMFVTKH